MQPTSYNIQICRPNSPRMGFIVAEDLAADWPDTITSSAHEMTSSALSSVRFVCVGGEGESDPPRGQRSLGLGLDPSSAMILLVIWLAAVQTGEEEMVESATRVNVGPNHQFSCQRGI